MQKLRKYATILGTKIDSTTVPQVLNQARIAVKSKKKLVIVTPNPEIVVTATYDSTFLNIINSSDVSVPDGIGLIWAANFLKEPQLTLIKGRTLFLDLIKLANELNLKVGLLGSKATESAAANLSLKYPGAKILSFIAPQYAPNATPVSEEDAKIHSDILRYISSERLDMLFVGLGAPKQEYWISKYGNDFSIPLQMAVGGSFDLIGGSRKAVPSLLTQNGLEWLGRLIYEDRGLTGIRRIFTAIIIFPLKVLLNKIAY